jgi:ribosomal protein S18 acetylase RimI-like enzyme
VPIAEDGWLSERIGYPVYTLGVDAPPGELVEELGRHASAQQLAMYQAKLPTLSVEEVRALCGAGMYPVEVNVTMCAEARAVAELELPDSGVAVVSAGEEHAAGALRVAESSFRFTRFHLDPAVPDRVADAIKRSWVESYVRGERGEEILVALEGDRVVGFLAALAGPDARVIDLVGVDSGAQARGVGPTLTRHFAQGALARFRLLEVGTQAANTIATRMYERLGFVVKRTVYTLHMHVGTPHSERANSRAT